MASPALLLLFFSFLATAHATIEIGQGIGVGTGWGGKSGGGGGYYYPSPPPPHGELQPCDFINEKQYHAYLVIQQFKKTITCDPFGVTETWVGPRPCNYKGFGCDTPPNLKDTPTIAAVDFNGFQLAAPTVRNFVDKLPDLAFFHANTNNFSDTLPDLSKLPFIYEVDVSNNRMSGPFPTQVVNIPQILFADLRYNTFCGTVPPSIFNVKLAVLFINNNGFSSQIPANLGSTTSKYLTLANNGFTGSFPRSICNAADTLQEIIALNNRLTGCLPYEIGFLRKATVFDIGDNQISGPIPYSFGCLFKIEQLNLARNLLFGEVPDVVCQLCNLQNLSLSSNYFTSIGHSCYALLENGVLDVKNNCIPGLPNQRSPEECHKFAYQPKSCPSSPYHYFMPCKAPKYGVGGTASPPMSYSISAPSPGYAAVHNRHP